MEKWKEKNKETEGRVNKKRIVCPWNFFSIAKNLSLPLHLVRFSPVFNRTNVKTKHTNEAGRVGRSVGRLKNDFNMHAYKWKRHQMKRPAEKKKKMIQSNKWDVNTQQQHACLSRKKSHFGNMRCVYRPVPQRWTTMGNTKMGKGNHTNGMNCQIQRSFRERISSKRRRSYEKERTKHTK